MSFVSILHGTGCGPITRRAPRTCGNWPAWGAGLPRLQSGCNVTSAPTDLLKQRVTLLVQGASPVGHRGRSSVATARQTEGKAGRRPTQNHLEPPGANSDGKRTTDRHRLIWTQASAARHVGASVACLGGGETGGPIFEVWR